MLRTKAKGRTMAELQKIRYTHDALIDAIIANPEKKQGELARIFGYTEGWLSQVIASDLFQARLAQRKEEIVDPTLVQAVEQRLEGLAMQSLQVVVNKLQADPTFDKGIKALEVATKALGYGAKAGQQQVAGNIQNNYIVQAPGPAKSTESWQEAFAPEIRNAELIEMIEDEEVTEDEKSGIGHCADTAVVELPGDDQETMGEVQERREMKPPVGTPL